AASLAAGIGGSAGVAISGAGAFSQNVILTHTNAFVDSSVVDSAGDVALEAKSTSAIQSTVAAASVAIGAGGSGGVGASIGVSISRNLIGWTPDDTRVPAEVQAYISNSSITADGTLGLSANASQTINSLVLAAS